MGGGVRQPGMTRLWTEADIEQLRLLAAEKLSHAEIARRINRTTPAVDHALWKFRLATSTKSRITQAEKDRMKVLYAQGMKKLAIARELKRGKNIVTQVLAEAKAPVELHPAFMPKSEPFIRPPTLAQLMSGRAR